MKHRTAREISSEEGARLPVGRRLWRASSRVKLPSPLVGLSGIHRASGTVYSTRAYGVVAWRYKPQADPRTSYQLSRRQVQGLARSNWKHLTAAQRQAWGRYALATGLSQPEMSENQAGYTQYVRAQTYRVPMRGSLGADAPNSLPPGGIASIAQVAPPNDAAFALRIIPGADTPPGCRLLVELTPATRALTRAPEEKHLKWFAVSDSDNFLPLSAEGDLYLLETARFPVPAGSRFGVRVRLINAEGVPGEPRTADFVKLPADPEGWSLEEIPSPAETADVPPPDPVSRQGRENEPGLLPRIACLSPRRPPKQRPLRKRSELADPGLRQAPPPGAKA